MPRSSRARFPGPFCSSPLSRGPVFGYLTSYYSERVMQSFSSFGGEPVVDEEVSVTVEEFREKLAGGGTVPLTAPEWEALASSFPEVESHETLLAGRLVIIRVGEELAAVEAPSKTARVARLLGGETEVRAFVSKRLEEYERMWDGCGVKIDYHEPA